MLQAEKNEEAEVAFFDVGTITINMMVEFHLLFRKAFCVVPMYLRRKLMKKCRQFLSIHRKQM